MPHKPFHHTVFHTQSPAQKNSHNKKFIETHTFDDEDALSKIKTDNSNMMGEYGASGLHIVTIQQIAAVAFCKTCS